MSVETARSPLLDWSAAAASKPGEARCGDQHAVFAYPSGTVVAVLDGLGHGAEAEAAAKQAVETLRRHAAESAIALIRRCHLRLLGTRGAVMALAVFSSADHTMTWLGIGNVEGILLRAGPGSGASRENLICRGGVVGYQLPSLSAAVLPVGRGDRLIFHTDGIEGGFPERCTPDEPPGEASARILAAASRGSDDALVLVADYLGGAP